MALPNSEGGALAVLAFTEVSEGKVELFVKTFLHVKRDSICVSVIWHRVYFCLNISEQPQRIKVQEDQ